MVSKKQLEEALSILITKVDTINERTKKHTKDIKQLEKKLKQISQRTKMEYTEKQVEKFMNKNEKKWNDLIRSKYILISEHKTILKKVESKRKKEFNVLFKAIKDLNKTIKKLGKQEIFLNELLDNRELKIKRAREDLNS